MNNPILGLKKEFESRVKLGIMSILMVHTEMDYNDLKNILQVTDGNLASHLKSLEHLNYIKMEKAFEGRKTKTTYSVTQNGKKAFEEHLNALEILVQSNQS